MRQDIEKWFGSDNEFHSLYPASFHELARTHWTPLRVAQKAADFLTAEPGVKILDIGSGIGKFCLAAAYYRPNAFYYGIEQREDLVTVAEKARLFLGMTNVAFTTGNFLELDFGQYDHFYFYNSFYENLVPTYKIDTNVAFSVDLYNQYNRYLYRQLAKKPSGTRVVTYHGMDDILPPGYLEAGSDINNFLKYWVKE